MRLLPLNVLGFAGVGAILCRDCLKRDDEKKAGQKLKS